MGVKTYCENTSHPATPGTGGCPLCREGRYAQIKPRTTTVDEIIDYVVLGLILSPLVIIWLFFRGS